VLHGINAGIQPTPSRKSTAMNTTQTPAWTSGSWTVTPGNEEAFVARWEEFLQWTRNEAAGFDSAHLISDRANPQHYVSFARWQSFDSTQAWRALPGFGPHFNACRSLCDDLYAGDYDLKVTI
jgi:heme-degrading monooxygenase HmoA